MRRAISKILFFLAMIILAVVLTVTAVLVCAVKVLHPGVLTPLTETVANDILHARVDIGRVELAFVPAFPMLQLRVDSLRVRSEAFDSVPAAERGELPVWADSILSIDHFRGAVNVSKLLSKGAIDLHHVEIDGLGVNIVLDRSGRGNFDIYTSTDTTTSGKTTLPAISIDHFDFVNTHAIRYFNAADDTEASIVLLRDLSVDGTGEPVYSLQIDGNASVPVVRDIIDISDISFGLGGRVKWDPKVPALVSLDNFNVRSAFVSAYVSTDIEMDTTLIINKARIDISPVAVSDIVSLLPRRIRNTHRLYAPYFDTDAVVELSALLQQPYAPASGDLPVAQVTVSVPDCRLRWGKTRLERFGLEGSMDLGGSDLDAAVVHLDRLTVAGPATALTVRGRAWRLASDPAFDACVKGDMDLTRLPPIIVDKLRGYISGRLKADIDAVGSLSMFRQDNFHRLDVRGTLDGSKLYYLAGDTSNMVEINSLALRFGTQFKGRRDTSRSRLPMLAAALKIDTATVLSGGVDIALSGLSLGAGVENSRSNGDTTLVVPVGGGLKVKRLNIFSITDSAGARMRDIAGRVSLRRYKGEKRVPEILANLEVGRVSAGSLDVRFVISKAHVEAAMHKLTLKNSDRARRFRQQVDSVRRVYPNIPPDSVFRLVYEKRHHPKGYHHTPRVHGELNKDDIEVLDWGLSKGFRKFLIGWSLQGSLTTHRARLFTPSFPLRNRVSNLAIDFSNDSILIRDLRYRAGRSDLAMTGRISNLRGGLTATGRDRTLKANLLIQSDTIDVNQLTAAIFAGAAYEQRIRAGQSRTAMDRSDNDDEAERELEALISKQSDSVAPVLIPTNINAQLRLQAANILYSDLQMTDMGGDILLYDGGLNLSDLRARSDAGNLNFSALYSAPKADDIHIGFGLDLDGFNIERFLSLVPAVDSVMPLMRDFSGIIDAEVAATARVDSTMNILLPTLDAAVRLTGDSLAFINPKTYATLGKWLRFKDRTDNKIKHINVEMIVRDNVLRIFPFSFNIDRYRLGLAGYNDLNMNFDYHIAVLKSPIPFKFGITIKGNPEKYKIRFGGAKFKEGQVAESVNIVDTARVSLLKQIEGVFRRGVSRSKFARLNIQSPDIASQLNEPDRPLTAADSAALIREGLIEAPVVVQTDSTFIQSDNAPKNKKSNRKVQR